MTWTDLSDEELAARLHYRGVDDTTVLVLVEGRDDPLCVPIIDEYLS